MRTEYEDNLSLDAFKPRLVATAVWQYSGGWQASICEPYFRAVWRGNVYREWSDAQRAADAYLDDNYVSQPL